MTIALTKEMEAFVEEQVRAGVSPDAVTLVNEVLCSVSERRLRSFEVTPELEAWLLEAADAPNTTWTSSVEVKSINLSSPTDRAQ